MGIVKKFLLKEKNGFLAGSKANLPKESKGVVSTGKRSFPKLYDTVILGFLAFDL